ncbi:MAG: DUF3426 domain-containing protein [Aliidongia sp.]
MIVTCPACATRFLVDPAALGPQGRMVRCARCAETWFQAPPPPDATPAPPRFDPLPPEPVVTPPPSADGSPAVPTEPMPSFIGGRDRLDRPRLPAIRKPPPRFTPVQIGWAALSGFVVLLFLALFLFRAEITAVWPATQRLYGLVGFRAPGPDSWFSLTGLKTASEAADGQINLIVSGEIANVSDAPHAMPKLRVVLLDAQKKIVKSKDFQVTGDPLTPGQSVPFQTSVAAADGATEVNVNWATE